MPFIQIGLFAVGAGLVINWTDKDEKIKTTWDDAGMVAGSILLIEVVISTAKWIVS